MFMLVALATLVTFSGCEGPAAVQDERRVDEGPRTGAPADGGDRATRRDRLAGLC